MIPAFFAFPIILIVLVVAYLRTMIIVVPQQTAAVVSVFGKFYAVKEAGLRLKYPYPFAVVEGRVSLRLSELRSQVAVKTKDNVFVEIPTAAQYRVIPSLVQKAFYELSKPEQQIQSFVLNIVRTSASIMSFEELYTEKDRIAQTVETELNHKLEQFGYRIDAVLIDQPEPSVEVRDAFNRVIAAQRAQDAAVLQGEAYRIKKVAEATAEMQAKKLQGQGIAAQRTEIARGFHESMDLLKSSAPTVPESVLLAMVMMTNQYDTIRDAAHGPATTVLMPYGGDGAISDLMKLTAAFEAVQGGRPGRPAPAPWGAPPKDAG